MPPRVVARTRRIGRVSVNTETSSSSPLLLSHSPPLSLSPLLLRPRKEERGGANLGCVGRRCRGGGGATPPIPQPTCPPAGPRPVAAVRTGVRLSDPFDCALLCSAASASSAEEEVERRRRWSCSSGGVAEQQWRWSREEEIERSEERQKREEAEAVEAIDRKVDEEGQRDGGLINTTDRHRSAQPWTRRRTCAAAAAPQH